MLSRISQTCRSASDEQGEVAVVLRGGKGVGKSFVAEHFGRLFGRHYLKVSQPGHLVGNFNSHLRDVVVLFADEAFYAGDKRRAWTWSSRPISCI